MSLALSFSSGAHAQSAVRLDRETVIALARAHAPEVRVAEARVAEAQAMRIGGRIFAGINPEIGLTAGPRWPGPGANQPLSADVTLSLAWPLDVSGTRMARGAWASALVRWAQAALDEARWNAVAEALDLWVRVLGADERIRLEQARSELDEAVAHIAQARRSAGTSGDGDVALATMVRADGQSRLRLAQGERDALVEQLRLRVGLSSDTPVTVEGTLDVTDPAPLEQLVAALSARQDVVRAGLLVDTARQDLEVQRRLGTPVPRVTVIAGRENELFARGGIDVPLPLYQRNQMAVAGAEARVYTGGVERAVALDRARSELRGAYTRYRAARVALDALESARTAVDDAERFAMRAYELGQRDLASAVLTRRESGLARLGRLDGRIALARARVTVDHAAGRR